MFYLLDTGILRISFFLFKYSYNIDYNKLHLNLMNMREREGCSRHWINSSSFSRPHQKVLVYYFQKYIYLCLPYSYGGKNFLTQSYGILWLLEYLLYDMFVGRNGTVYQTVRQDHYRIILLMLWTFEII